ncbi:hypothetical protein KC734_15935 [candidate division KSB1 bacterium]|nr:hypothetical protein [candidate division KSB1 bacterium]
MAINLDDVRSLLPQIRSELFSKPNVVATGIGYKIVDGKPTGELSIICSVESKKAKNALSASELIPASIQSVPTDIYATGQIHALQSAPTDRYRPAPGGISVGHFRITAGTLGCYVKKNGKFYILSNNHVLANSNDAQAGDAILQPGPTDGGSTSGDQIAKLSEFVPITFQGSGGGGGSSPCPIANAAASVLNAVAGVVGSKTQLQPVKKAQAGENLVDAAIAEPLNPDDVKNEIMNIGQISGSAEATLGMPLKKMGRTTGLTTGSVLQIDVTSQVSYGGSKVGVFVDQIMAGGMSAGGDSGSAVLNDDNEIVGLLFAGSTNTTIINRIQNVFTALQISLP